MRIAMMTNNYKPFIGGVPISIERLSEGLRAIGHEVVIFAPDYNGQEEDENIVRYHSLIKGVANGASVPNSLDARIEKRFKEGDFDVIHVHHPMLIGKTALYLSKKYNVPLCFTYHTRYEQYLHYIKMSFLRDFVPYYVNNFISQCDIVFAPTPTMRDYLIQIGSGASLAVLPTGIGRESFEADKDEVRRLRKELIGGKKYLFCTVARLAKEKNIDFLLRALAMRKERQISESNRISGETAESLVGQSDFRLVVVGDGPCRNELEKLAKKLNLEEEIVFAGKVPNEQVKNYCKAADLFLFASESETQGIVILEAMAASTPVLAINATGVCDVVVNGRNGYMTDASEEEYINKLSFILEQDREYLEKGAIETAEKYEMQEIAKRAALYYNTAIQNHGRHSEKVSGIRSII